jgi:hypothetical protein
MDSPAPRDVGAPDGIAWENCWKSPTNAPAPDNRAVTKPFDELLAGMASF